MTPAPRSKPQPKPHTPNITRGLPDWSAVAVPLGLLFVFALMAWVAR